MAIHVKEHKPEKNHLADMYFNLLKDTLLNIFYKNLIDKCIKYGEKYSWESRFYYTGIGSDGLDNIRFCCEDVIKNNIQGDFLEAGIWRGGATIYMAAIAKFYQQERNIWALDGFQGMPPINRDCPHELTDYSNLKGLIAPLSEVREAFEKFDVLEKTIFVPGWFNESLLELNIEKIAVLRLDNDYYESTLLTIEKFYPKVPIGGWIIIDDYDCVPGATTAINHFREKYKIKEQMYRMNKTSETGIYWQKQYIQHEF